MKKVNITSRGIIVVCYVWWGKEKKVEGKKVNRRLGEKVERFRERVSEGREVYDRIRSIHPHLELLKDFAW